MCLITQRKTKRVYLEKKLQNVTTTTTDTVCRQRKPQKIRAANMTNFATGNFLMIIMAVDKYFRRENHRVYEFDFVLNFTYYVYGFLKLNFTMFINY